MGKREKWIILILLVVTPFILRPMMGNFFSHDIEDVRKKIKEHLYEKYGEEFVVDRIGTRSSRGEEFFQARIYPKEIVGTNKEGDDYYYASATVGKKLFGRLGAVGDSYSYVMLNKTGEDYMRPKVKEIFGNRVRLKLDSKLKIWGREEIIVEEYRENDPSSNGTDAFVGYKEADFKEARKRVLNDTKNNRLFLDLDVYIFNHIENEKEKKKRRKDIFEFIQYLKEEGLFEYLEMRIIFVDERVLAPSYDKFERKIKYSNKVKVEVKEEDTTVELPPKELRERMSEKLQTEVEEMSEEQLLANIRKIKKDELNYDDLRKWNSQRQVLIYSEKMLKERYGHDSDYGRIKDYDEKSDILIQDNLEYVYIN